MRSREVIDQELRQLAETTKKYFGAEINFMDLQAQVHKIIKEKVGSYFYNRYRDWQVPELFELSDAIEKSMEISKKYYRAPKG